MGKSGCSVIFFLGYQRHLNNQNHFIMQQLHYCLGLPRTCSSVIMNILNENPRIFTTGTCCMPYLVDACQERSGTVSEFIALDKDVLHNSYINFLRQGMRGWFEAMTDKPIVFSKSRIERPKRYHLFI